MMRVDLVLLGVALAVGHLHAGVIISYDLDSPGTGVVQPGYTGKVSADNYDPRSTAIGEDGSSNTISGFSVNRDNVYMRATGTMQSSLAGSGTPAYHTFGLSVSGLNALEVLDLTAVHFTHDVSGVTASTAFFFSFYSDAVGFADAERLENGNWGDSPNEVTIDLTADNAVAGSSFTGLTNGTDIEFRIYFGDDGTNEDNSSAIHRVRQYLTIEGDTRVVPEPATGTLVLLALGAVLARRCRPRIRG